MVTIYALQNIYGKYDELMEALTFIDLENGLNRAVFLGNYMTKGPKSAAVLYELKRLEETYPEQTAVLPGETEQFFLTWLSGKLDHWDWLSLDNFLLATRSFFQERTFDELTNRTIREKLTGSDLYEQYRHFILENHPDLLLWLFRKTDAIEKPAWKKPFQEAVSFLLNVEADEFALVKYDTETAVYSRITINMDGSFTEHIAPKTPKA